MLIKHLVVKSNNLPPGESVKIAPKQISLSRNLAPHVRSPRPLEERMLDEMGQPMPRLSLLPRSRPQKDDQNSPTEPGSICSETTTNPLSRTVFANPSPPAPLRCPYSFLPKLSCHHIPA
jgi:hypothetical protein